MSRKLLWRELHPCACSDSDRVWHTRRGPTLSIIAVYIASRPMHNAFDMVYVACMRSDVGEGCGFGCMACGCICMHIRVCVIACIATFAQVMNR